MCELELYFWKMYKNELFRSKILKLIVLHTYIVTQYPHTYESTPAKLCTMPHRYIGGNKYYNVYITCVENLRIGESV